LFKEKFNILPFSENNLIALTTFVKEVDATVLAYPKKCYPKEQWITEDKWVFIG